MCGRTTSITPPERLAEIFAAALDPAAVEPDVAGPRYNVAPTTAVLGVRVPPGGDDGVDRLLGRFRWGLVPSWSKDLKAGNRLFNARAETVAEKPAFRTSFASRRLAVLADGFYEWRRLPGGVRQPYYFRRSDGYPIAFAGLWAPWKDDNGAWVLSCTIVTTTAGDDMDGVHDRMPVILERGDLGRWLRPDRPDDRHLLVPAPSGTLLRHPVDPRVGNVRNDDAALVEEVAA